MIHKFILAFFCLLAAGKGFSQADSSKPAYLQFPSLPQFSIYNAKDSSVFTRDDLKKRRPVVFIMFSPECDHCKHETQDLITNIQKFKKVQIVMATWLPFDEMKTFYNEYNIASYPQITMGRDARFYLPPFFSVSSLPAIYVYDKKGNFKTSFQGSVKMDKIINAL